MKAQVRWVAVMLVVAAGLVQAADGNAPVAVEAAVVKPAVTAVAPAPDAVASATNAPQLISLTLDDVPLAEVVVMSHSRHFPFLDEAAQFNDVLLRFLKAQSSLNGTGGVLPNFFTHEHQPVR